MTMKVPIVDLTARYRGLEEETKAAALSVFESGIFILGPEVERFEREAARYIGTKYAVGVASGTDALHLSLRACGVGQGHEVITTPYTFIATAEAIAYTGAVPVFADIHSESYNIDPDKIEENISGKTKAILPVHLYGQGASMDAIMELAARHGLRVIEDNAQAFGGEYRGKKLGSIGDVSCASFFPTKNLGCAGDGGMVFTDDEEIAENVRELRNHGARVRHTHRSIGYNSRLDAIQAAVLRVHLRRLDRWNALRRKHAEHYGRRLKGNRYITLPAEMPENKHVYHLFPVKVNDRKALREFLEERGVAGAIHYPVPVPEQESLSHLECGKGEYPVSSGLAKEVLCLPMFPELSEEQVDYVCDCLLEFFDKGTSKNYFLCENERNCVRQGGEAK